MNQETIFECMRVYLAHRSGSWPEKTKTVQVSTRSAMFYRSCCAWVYRHTNKNSPTCRYR